MEVKELGWSKVMTDNLDWIKTKEEENYLKVDQKRILKNKTQTLGTQTGSLRNWSQHLA